MSSSQPLVSIGVPVYNGERSLRKALNSLVGQSHSNLEIIISDNASTDETEAICLDFAARDNRIRYYRNPRNEGAMGNFHRVLALAVGDYFMWAAHDDEWDARFIEANLTSLLCQPDVMASVSRVRFQDGDTVASAPAGTFPLMGTAQDNVLALLRDPGKNSRFYGLFRRQVLLQCFEPESYWAGDWALMIRALRYGKFHEVRECLFTRQINGGSTDVLRSIRSANRGLLGCAFPMARFTVKTLREKHVPRHAGVFLILLRHNLIYTWLFFSTLLTQSSRDWFKRLSRASSAEAGSGVKRALGATLATKIPG